MSLNNIIQESVRLVENLDDKDAQARYAAANEYEQKAFEELKLTVPIAGTKDKIQLTLQDSGGNWFFKFANPNRGGFLFPFDPYVSASPFQVAKAFKTLFEDFEKEAAAIKAEVKKISSGK